MYSRASAAHIQSLPIPGLPPPSSAAPSRSGAFAGVGGGLPFSAAVSPFGGVGAFSGGAAAAPALAADDPASGLVVLACGSRLAQDQFHLPLEGLVWRIAAGRSDQNEADFAVSGD